MHRYRIVNNSSAILDQVSTSCNRTFGVTLSPQCSYRAPISQQRGPWHSPREWEHCMKHMLGTLSTDVILFCKAKTVRFEEQIISKDKYLSMQVKWRLLCLVFFKYFPNHTESENWGISLASNVWLLLKLHAHVFFTGVIPGTCISIL